MVAVVSLLDAEHSLKVKSLIDQIEEKFGLTGVQMTPFPHITWLLVTADHTFGKLKECLQQVAALTKPFEIKTTGLGIFPGVHPVVHIPVVRNQVTNAFHEQLFHKIRDFAGDIPSYYFPENWVPHFSLALADTNPECATDILFWLNEQNFTWQINIDNLAIMLQCDDKFIKDKVYLFGNPDL